MAFFAENSNDKPTIISEPDTRFATSMLSTKYRIHAVPGEALMDKTSGEIFIKRPSDGKIVSFFQNKQLYYDLLMEVRLNIANNPDFKSPITSDDFTGKSFMYSVNYDLANIYDTGEKLINLVDLPVDLSGESSILFSTTASFIIGAKSNGFFIRVATRDCDKAVVEYATYVKDLDTNTTDEDPKFNKNYKLTMVLQDLDGGHTLQKSFYGRLNETLCCTFTDQEINYASNNGVNSVKIQFHIASLITNYLDDSFLMDNHMFQIQSNIAKLRAADGRVEIAETNIIGFIDNVATFTLPFCAHILAFLDSDIVLDMLEKTKHGVSSDSVIVSVNKPATYIWTTDCIWGEKIRNVAAAGVTTNTASTTTFDALETYFTQTINLEGFTLEEIT